jgi:competence protein ComEA
LSGNASGRILLVGAAVVLTASVAGTLWLAGTAGSAREVTLDAEPSVSAISPRDAELVVDVAGAVARPGVLRLAAGSRVADAIAAAGGFAPTVDAAAASATLNLAAPLQDGVKIVVPQRGRTSQAAGAPAPSSKPARVDLNIATQAELEALPGIGPVTAKKIVDARADAPFRSPDDLATRKLVGASTLEKIRDLISIGG